MDGCLRFIFGRKTRGGSGRIRGGFVGDGVNEREETSVSVNCFCGQDCTTSLVHGKLYQNFTLVDFTQKKKKELQFNYSPLFLFL